MIFDLETWSLIIAAAVFLIVLASIYSIGPTQIHVDVPSGARE